MSSLRNRFPRLVDIVPVYAVISFMLYGWTFILFLWKLTSWLHFLTGGEIFAAFCYGVIVNIAESLIFLGLLLFLCAVLPSAALLKSFRVRGSLITILTLGGIMGYQYEYRAVREQFTDPFPYWAIATLIIILIGIFLSEKIHVIKSIILDLSDRLIIFLYLLIPMSLLSILVILIRNFS